MTVEYNSKAAPARPHTHCAIDYLEATSYRPESVYRVFTFREADDGFGWAGRYIWACADSLDEALYVARTSGKQFEADRCSPVVQQELAEICLFA